MTSSTRDLLAQVVAEQHRHREVLERLRETIDAPDEYNRIIGEYRLEMNGGVLARLR